MNNGGRRPNAGRKKGSQNKTTKIARDLLLENRGKLISKAIKEALNGNTPLLSKLLDKLIPTLERSETIHSGSIEQKVINMTPAERQEKLELLKMKINAN